MDLVVGGVDEIEPGEKRGRRIYDDVRIVHFNIYGHRSLTYTYLASTYLRTPLVLV